MREVNIEGVRAFVALVSPDWAKKMLGLSKFNRNINRNYVQKLKRDLINGRWELTGESIIVVGDYEDLSDGHHRLTAIAETGISALSVVVIGVQRSTKVDIGRNRSVKDQAVMSGVADQIGDIVKSSLFISGVNTCLRIKGGRRNDIDDIKQYYLRNKDVFDKAFIIASKKYGDNRLHAQRGTKSAALFLSIAGAINSGVDMCVLAEWYKVFSTGYYDECSIVDTNTAKSVLLLRKYFDSQQNASVNTTVAVEQIGKCMSSIYAFDNGKSIKHIKGAIYYKIPELEKLQ